MAQISAFPYGGDPLQALNLYEHPPGAPCVLFVHGGGWQRGDKDRMTLALQHHANRLSGRFTVLSMNYRLAPAALFPAQVDDAHLALDWIAAQAGEQGFDPATVVFTESAGAAHGGLAALSGRHPQVRGLIGFAGVFDLSVEDDTTPLGQLVATYLGCDPHECRPTAEAASPAHNPHVRPPALFVHSTGDPVVGAYQSVIMANVIGPGAHIHFIPGSGHTGPDFMTPAVDAAVDTYLARVFGPA
jgi:triacylglycerol lipase/alpha-L-fucosidase 2